MNDNELNELIKINHNAPREHLEEDLFVNHKNEYVLFYEDDFYLWEGEWNKIVYHHGYYELTGLRSLSDINTIIQLEQQKRELLNCIQDADSYLNTNCLAKITTSSGFHMEFKRLLTQKDLTND